MTGAEAVALAAVGGLLNLDRAAVFQSMASRPLVGATVAGAVVGQAGLGLLCGALLELLWLLDLPVGASIPQDEALAGLMAAVFAAAAPAGWSLYARAGVGVLLAVPFGALGRWVDLRVRRGNEALAERALRDPAALARCHWTGVGRFFGAGAANAAAGAAVATWVVRPVLAVAPPWVPVAAELVEALLPVVGAAAVLGATRPWSSWGLFAGGLVAGAGFGRWRRGTPWQP